MAKELNGNQDTQLQRRPQPPQRQQEDIHVFKISWLLVPLCILGMWHLLSRVRPTVTWDAVMDLLDVKDRERYSALAILCLLLTLVVATVRIIGRKDNT